MFFVSLIVFLIIRLIPGDPVLVILGADEPGAIISEETYQAVQQQLGLDKPIYVQYFKWMWRNLNGDLGMSLKSQRPVLEVVLERYPASIYLAIVSVIVGLLISIPLGVLAAWKQNSATDYTAMGFALFGVSIPNFYFSILLILLFGVYLGWLPTMGYASPWEDFGKFLMHASLPMLAMGSHMAARITRFLRSDMVEQLQQDYIRTARAKGLKERTILTRHALRNSLTGAITVVGLEFARLLGGSTIVESIFAWPGVGRLLLEAIFARDFTVVQGSVLFLALTFTLANIVVDVLYKWIDPRVTLG